MNNTDINFILPANPNKIPRKYILVSNIKLNSSNTTSFKILQKEFFIWVGFVLSDIILFISLKMELSRMEFNLIPLMQMLIYVFIVLKTLEFAFPSLFQSKEAKSQKTMMTGCGKESEI